MAERKGILLRLDPAVHDALARWASAELRSTNAQIEFLLRRALAAAGRLPDDVGTMRRPGRPRGSESGADDPAAAGPAAAGPAADSPAADSPADPPDVET